MPREAMQDDTCRWDVATVAASLLMDIETALAHADAVALLLQIRSWENYVFLEGH
jgi:hypothetical protein